MQIETNSQITDIDIMFIFVIKKKTNKVINDCKKIKKVSCGYNQKK